jgi:uncharacterized protein (DUF58 family)
MKWVIATILLALLAMVLNLSLLVYALYAIAAILFISSYVTSRWTQSVEAERICNSEAVNLGQSVSVIIKVRHTGNLPIACARNFGTAIGGHEDEP